MNARSENNAAYLMYTDVPVNFFYQFSCGFLPDGKAKKAPAPHAWWQPAKNEFCGTAQTA
jgi:hypothetical protein